MASFKCKYCGEYTHVDNDKFDGIELCRQHINNKELDFKKAKEKVRQAVIIFEKQGRFKDFEPRLRKMVKSSKGMYMFNSYPLTEILFDFELHFRGISHLHQYGMPFGYRVDFCLDKIGAVVEIDGAYHNQKAQANKDGARDSSMENGLRTPVARISDEKIVTNLKKATDEALKMISVKGKFLGKESIQEKYKIGPSFMPIDRMGYYQ